MARGGRKPLTSSPPNFPSPRKPSANVKSPNAPPKTKPTNPKPSTPPVKPTKPKPKNAPTKPSMLGNVGTGLGTGALLIGGSSLLTGGAGGGGLGGLFGLAGQGIQTAGTVAVADKAIDAVKDMVGGITKNPMNLAIVAGVIGAVVFLGKK